MNTRMMGSKIEASRARGSAIRAQLPHNGSHNESWDELCGARARRKGPIWPDYKPEGHPETTLEEMLMDNKAVARLMEVA